MKLYFQHSNGEFEYIANVDNANLGMNEIMSDLNRRNPNFISYYQRIWRNDDKKQTWVDVGSHTEFYMMQE